MPSSTRSPRRRPTSRPSRRSIRPGCPPRRGSNGTWSSTTSAWRSSTRTRSAAGSTGPRRPATSATPCSRCSRAAPRRSRSGSSGSRTALEGVPVFLEQARSRAVGPQVGLWQKVELRYAKDLPGLFAEVREASEEVLDARELARLDRAIHGARTALDDHIAWLDGTLATRHRGLAAGPRALRRAGPPARLRRPGRGHDPRDRLGPAAHEHGGAPRGRPRAGSRCGPAVRHRAPQGGPPGHLRGRPRGVQGRDAPRPRLPHRARHRHRPG